MASNIKLRIYENKKFKTSGGLHKFEVDIAIPSFYCSPVNFFCMSLIIMAVFDTEKNGRSEYTEKTLYSLNNTVDFSKHNLVIIDNASCEKTKSKLNDFFLDGNGKFFGAKKPTLITLSENIGTARAINLGIKLRKNGEHIIKIDNDVVIKDIDWADQMEEVIKIDPAIGIVGLKRKDLRQTPYDPDPNFRSELRQLPHNPGEPWIIIEETQDIMGTCTMLSSKLIDTIGGYVSPMVYAFDDTIYNLRAGLAGFKKCFLPHIDIEHIDTGNNPYSQEKIAIANEAWPKYHKLHQAYIDGTRPLYEEI